MKVTLAQLNPVVGDVEANRERISEVFRKYVGKTDLIVFPELYLTGYPPRDLLLNKRFIEKVSASIEEIEDFTKSCGKTGVLFGAPVMEEKSLYNSALLVFEGEVIGCQHKTNLPSYDVFDESRYFKQSNFIEPLEFKKERLGVSICEDAWSQGANASYELDPLEVLAKKGSTVFINISASPFHIGKDSVRYDTIRSHVERHGQPLIYVNQVGGNDELVFDGTSIIFDEKAELVDVLPSFIEEIRTVSTDATGSRGYEPMSEIDSVFNALKLGVCDYMRKCGFMKAVVGLSGGVDSALTCVIAQAAVGKENVLGVSMPSRYTSKESLELSGILAGNLGIGYEVVPIDSIYEEYVRSLGKDESSESVDVTLQNVQARIRGNILMAYSNSLGHLVLSTGNKSEYSVGYCTLYGDMSGGLAVLSDVPKSMVYQLAEYVNLSRKLIPQEIIDRRPSAELKPDQFDQDTLPSYPVLDRILYLLMQEGLSRDEIVKHGLDPEDVDWVVSNVKSSEYKRLQAPLGLKVTSKAFGSGRRMPIAAKYDL